MWTTVIVKTFWKCSGVDQLKETDRPDSPPALFRFSTLLQCLGPKRQKNKKIQKRQFAKLHFYLSRWSSGANGHRYDSLSSKQNKKMWACSVVFTKNEEDWGRFFFFLYRWTFRSRWEAPLPDEGKKTSHPGSLLNSCNFSLVYLTVIT